MRILPAFIFIILSCFFSLVGYSQSSTTEYYFKRISIEHGLSQSGVTTMVRDHKGLLWIGTRQGINRVDRNHLKKYIDDYVYQLLEDAQQNLWAITPKGVLRYNSDQDTFLPIINQQLFSICTHKKVCTLEVMLLSISMITLLRRLSVYLCAKTPSLKIKNVSSHIYFL